jgi:hypothetical protein
LKLCNGVLQQSDLIDKVLQYYDQHCVLLMESPNPMFDHWLVKQLPFLLVGYWWHVQPTCNVAGQ